MTADNSETQDIVDSVATENTDVDSQEVKEWGQDDTGQQESETDAQETQEPEKPKRNRAQERIEHLARENAELKRKQAEYEVKQQTTELKRPVIDDFEDFREYEEALEDYQAAKAEARVMEKLQKQQSTQAEDTRAIELQVAASEIEETGVDLNAYFQKAESLPPLPLTLDQFGLSAKETLLLAKELLDDEATYVELSRMNPVQAAVKIGLIIESKKGKAAPAVSRAPKPITPVQANAATTRDSSKMSDDEWYKSEIQKRKGK